ncbi:MAG: Minf_1886 family protein, partial [Chthoniobacterales bacterium]
HQTLHYLLRLQLVIIIALAPSLSSSLAMQKIGFAEALDSIVAADQRYHRDAYVFLRDALDYTTKQQKKTKGAAVRHVAGPELLDGVRLYALKEFGPMALTVFSYWGIERCEDIGAMVFNLIGAGIFGKTEQDSPEDFKSVYTFHDAFVKPFLPEKATPAGLLPALPAPKLS